MHTLKTTKIVSAALIGLILSACGGGASSPLDPVTSSSSLSSGAVDTTSPVSIGYGVDSNFAKGQIGVSIGNAILSPGASTNLTVNIVSSTNTLASSPVSITFNSPCIASGEAKFFVNNEALTSNTITSNFGEATLTYTANGCVGADQVTATAVINGRQEVARATLNIASDTVLTVKALEPSHTQISLKGTGGQETADVSFLVSGATGAPVRGVTVDFTLSTESGGSSLGGLALVNNTGVSDKSGVVKTTVQAGNVATSVVVTAKARDTNIAATSKKLIVSTGIPDQDSVSLSATDLHPSGWDHDGIESTVVIRLADAFNNPVIDGTAVSFTTEGGAVDPSCTTVGGTCNVKWRSQSPRPQRDSSDNNTTRLLCVNALGERLSDAETNVCRRERAGRVTLLAYAVGNESFIDNNANGLYDYGIDTFKTHNDYPLGNPECNKSVPLSSLARPNNSPLQACDDLVEAYLDRNENGIRDNDEIFIDLNQDGNPSYENGIYNGVLCRDNDPHCTNKEKITIRDQIYIVMVSDHMLHHNDRFPFLANGVYLEQRPPANNSSSSSAPSTAITEAGTFFWVADKNGNGAPAGTTISVDSSGMKNATALLTNTGPLPASDDPTRIGVRFSTGTGAETPSGFTRIIVTFPTPGGGALRFIDEVHVNP